MLLAGSVTWALPMTVVWTFWADAVLVSTSYCAGAGPPVTLTGFSVRALVALLISTIERHWFCWCQNATTSTLPSLDVLAICRAPGRM